MIIPQYWAEGRARNRSEGRQVTVRRFGWSQTSQEEAQANAEQRAAEALQRVLAGEKLARREPKVPYNGAEGVPIREEVVERHGEVVITRNAYGARCLNTPNVLFADIDFAAETPVRLIFATMAGLVALAVLIGLRLDSFGLLAVLVLCALFGANSLTGWLYRLRLRFDGGAERLARKRVLRFLAAHPDWGLRLYRTPAGLRVLATHRTFAPDDPEVARCFAAVGADPHYVRMCLRQQCFRARVSAKPWRIGIDQHLRPRPGVWPVAAERLAQRREWVARYETAAGDYAACAFIEALGNAVVAPAVAEVQHLHDALCGSASGRPLA